MKGICDYCQKEFEGYIPDVQTFCTPVCDTLWWRNNVDGFDDFEATGLDLKDNEFLRKDPHTGRWSLINNVF